MSEPTLQQEIEARRPATEGTLRQMAKGVPILGKDPLGKAKYANVTESGDLKVQLSGNIPVLWGATIDDRPPASTVAVGQIFALANARLDMWISNGVTWEVID